MIDFPALLNREEELSAEVSEQESTIAKTKAELAVLESKLRKLHALKKKVLASYHYMKTEAKVVKFSEFKDIKIGLANAASVIRDYELQIINLRVAIPRVEKKLAETKETLDKLDKTISENYNVIDFELTNDERRSTPKDS